MPTATASSRGSRAMARLLHPISGGSVLTAGDVCREAPGHGGTFESSEEAIVRKLFVVLVVLAIGVAALGFYRGWFNVEWEKRPDGKGQITGTVDEEKIKQDRKAAEERVRDLGHQKTAATESNKDREAKPDRP